MAVCNLLLALATQHNLAICTGFTCTRAGLLDAFGEVWMARGRIKTELFGLAFLTIAVCFIHFAVVD